MATSLSVDCSHVPIVGPPSGKSTGERVTLTLGSEPEWSGLSESILIEDGWETWCGRGAWHVVHGTDVYGVWLRRFEPTPGSPTREATLAVSGASTRTR